MNSKTSDPTPDERAQASGVESSLGVLLRRAREAQNLSLRDVSDQTRISRRYLEAIEADDYKSLPGGIFNRSFIKAFARTVGVSEAEAIRAYERTARAHGESPDEVPTSRQRSRLYTDGEPARSPLVTVILSLLILAVISLGAYAALHWYQRRSEGRAVQPPANRPLANANNQTVTPANQPTPAPTPALAARGLNVQVKAKGEEVWLRSKVDGGSSTEEILKADQVKDLTAADTLSLQYSKSKAKALDVTINGRPAVVPTEVAKGRSLVEMTITKDDYARLLQQQP